MGKALFRKTQNIIKNGIHDEIKLTTVARELLITLLIKVICETIQRMYAQLRTMEVNKHIYQYNCYRKINNYFF